MMKVLHGAKIFTSPFLLWPLYLSSLALLLHGALLAAFLLYLIGIVLAHHALVQGGTDRGVLRLWLAALLPFWLVAFPAAVLRNTVRAQQGGIAYLQCIAAFSLGLLISAGVVWALPLKNGKAPEDIVGMQMILESDTQMARKAAVMDALNRYPFVAPWWLRNQHLQTVWNPFFRKQSPILYQQEKVNTPDGDFIYLHSYPGEADKPLLLLLHGLEGNVRSPYITGLNHTMHELGWNSIAMEFRFCSGVMNNTKRIYHMGETSDLDFVVRMLGERYPEKPLYVLGISLGGNVLGKWLGEQGENIPSHVKGAALISPPFNPSIGAPNFHEILYGVYVKNFLRTLVPKALEKEKQFPGSIDVEKVKNSKDFYTYDTEVTARLHGFVDAYDYWEKVGCHQFLEHVRVPTLLMTSEDDPFNPPETIPREIADNSPWLHPQWTTHGGHVGFVQGAAPMLASYWFEEQVARFFSAYAGMDAN